MPLEFTAHRPRFICFSVLFPIFSDFGFDHMKPDDLDNPFENFNPGGWLGTILGGVVSVILGIYIAGLLPGKPKKLGSLVFVPLLIPPVLFSWLGQSLWRLCFPARDAVPVKTPKPKPSLTPEETRKHLLRFISCAIVLLLALGASVIAGIFFLIRLANTDN